MKSLRLLCLVALASLLLASTVLAQSPTITSVTVKDTACTYKVGSSTRQCSIGPGMTLIVKGSNFGPFGGVIGTCDCPTATTVTWTSTRVTATVNTVNPNASITLETSQGGFSNAVPYTPLGPVITSIVVGNCTYIPNQSRFLCLITPGTQVTINGSYFGPSTSPGNQVITCDSCANATINSWDPNWLTGPSPYNNQIVITATEAHCGNTVAVFAGELWSNYVPYTAC
jgi:hypothetical protein